ncbi:MAG: hypothetical protein IIB57_11165, partial [Planctomycetes bacterium]|nr:hypothetical protein [Planctomycetota bacterium]
MQAVLLAGKRPTLAVLTLAALFSWPAAFGQEIRFMPIRSAPLGSPAGTIGDPVTAEFNTALGCWEYRISAGGIEVDLDLQAFGWGDALCTQPTGLCRLDPGDDCTIPVDCAACEDDLDCLHRLGKDGTCTDNGATCSGSGGACINDADCPMGELCIGRLAPCTLGAIQATVVPDGYANGQGGDLNPKGWPGSPGDGAYQSILACSDNGDPCNAPFGTGCGNRPGAICARNPNWVIPDCAVD